MTETEAVDHREEQVAAEVQRVEIQTILNDRTAEDGYKQTVTVLTSAQAAEIDAKLMSGDAAYSLDQLMELAGLSVAEVVFGLWKEKPVEGPILIICGSGNNGGDGLVAARHLKQFGVEEVMVKCLRSKSPRPLQERLLKLAIAAGVQMLGNYVELAHRDGALLVDAVFGFGLKGPPRGVFAQELQRMHRSLTSEDPPRPQLVCVDVPSGELLEKALQPTDAIISMMLPKCQFGCRHFLAGNFLLPKFAEEYGLVVPKFPPGSRAFEFRYAG